MSNYTIVGRLAADPDLHFSNNGVAVARMRVAVNRRKKVGDDWQDETVWHDVTCFKDLAENVSESLSKGDEIVAEGYLEEPRIFEWKQARPNGETHGVSLPFIANSLGLSLRWSAARAQERRNTGQGQTRPKQATPARPQYDSEEPF
jgi:single-strand DNA-binding protein